MSNIYRCKLKEMSRFFKVLHGIRSIDTISHSYVFIIMSKKNQNILLTILLALKHLILFLSEMRMKPNQAIVSMVV